MKSEIIAAVNKEVFGLVAFPTLIADTYSGFVYKIDEIEELFLTEKIVLRATDKAIILSDTEIHLSS